MSAKKWKKDSEALDSARETLRVLIEFFDTVEGLGLVKRWVLPGYCVFMKGEADE